MEIEVNDAGPFKSSFDIDTTNVVRREIITYRMVDGMMRKEMAVRTYFGSNDYTDSTMAIPLATYES
ncbi:hypothetical protein N9Z41_01350 [bacterium]|nr:hypothetical protein [bacterium]